MLRADSECELPGREKLPKPTNTDRKDDAIRPGAHLSRRDSVT